ncbi:MAG: hypothetical protein AUH83_07350 [Deltaproteobacteria bacterium 13_1_40CM_4_68_19]|nr:MAG: hypothetical protein AUH83_07350 [Deltaproteobacteria bacterium 13_1_40CM_4_68_19]OLD35314.1 MAG: hypothetical protein AUI19_02590 [Myxococcales bacterium 13_1_40CM_2_68_15]
MLRANQAVRLGLRAASRNAELSFAKGLINQGGNLLALLPIAFAAILIAALARGDALRSALLAARALAGLRWPVLGGIAAALSIALAASLLFWAGAVPLLAADAELNRRPPPGNFALLVSRGAARTVVAGILGWGISVLFTLACDAAVIFAIPALLLRPSPGLLAAAALAGAVAVTGTFLLDALARLIMVRAAAFGDSATPAFARAVSLLGARLGASALITVVFVALELIVGAVAASLTGLLSAGSFNPRDQVLALAPHAAIALAAAAVFGWLEVGRMGAFAALAADAEGLIAPAAPPEPPPRAELVVEALPADEA